MSTITIPKSIADKDDLVVLPKREHMTLLALRKTAEFMPTAAQKKALIRAESNLQTGKTLSYDELAS